MFSRFFNKLTKTSHLVYMRSVQDFGTGNTLMERIPRDLKNCEHLKPFTYAPKSSEDVEPKAQTDTSFFWTNNSAPPTHSFNIFNMKDWWANNTKLVFEQKQQYDPEMIKRMGNDIAAAHFILKWNGKIKFKDSDWMENTEKTPAVLPNSFLPDYILVAIDASNTVITYEGLKNLLDLKDVEWLSFKSCKYIDDWCIDKIVGNHPSLKYLDISDCINVTERGLEAIYKLFSLKTLIVTNHEKSAAFELTCLMLEDCNPDLECKILNSRYSNEHEELHEKK